MIIGTWAQRLSQKINELHHELKQQSGHPMLTETKGPKGKDMVLKTGGTMATFIADYQRKREPSKEYPLLFTENSESS